MKDWDESRLRRIQIVITISMVMCFAMAFGLLSLATAHAAEDPQISIKVKSTDTDWASPDTPATGKVGEYYRWTLDWTTFEEKYGGTDYVPVSFEMAYANLNPNTDYTYEVNMVHKKTGKVYEKVHGSNFTVPALGEGTASGSFRLETMVWTDFTGEWDVEFKVYPRDNPADAVIINSEGGDKSTTLNMRGISSMEISSDVMRTSGRIRYVPVNKLNEGGKVEGKVTLEGLEPSTTYTVIAQLGHREFMESSWMVIFRSADRVTISADTDETGKLSVTIPYPDDMAGMSPDYYYMNTFVVRKGDSATNEYYYLNNNSAGNNAEVYEYDNLNPNNVLYVLHDDTPDPGETKAIVEITNRIAGTGVLLPGAEFKIVKGSDPEGTEVVDSWTQGDENHVATLEIGDYVLVQTSVPEGYTLADPVPFSLTGDDAAARGYFFEGFNSVKVTEGGESVNCLTIRKDNGDEEGEVVFCMNATKEFGSRVDRKTKKVLYYTEYDISDEAIKDVIKTPRVPMEEMEGILKKLVYAGFPNDAAGLKEKYGISDSTLEVLTQIAIHYYTDSVDYENSFYYRYADSYLVNGIDFYADNVRAAFDELINTDIEPPAGMTVKFYMPSNDSYQTLISTKFREEEPVRELEVENEPEPEEGEDETEPEPGDNEGTDPEPEPGDNEEPPTEPPAEPETETGDEEVVEPENPAEETTAEEETPPAEELEPGKVIKVEKKKSPATGDEDARNVMLLLGAVSLVVMAGLNRRNVK